MIVVVASTAHEAELHCTVTVGCDCITIELLLTAVYHGNLLCICVLVHFRCQLPGTALGREDVYHVVCS
jgi:hypothetical protein